MKNKGAPATKSRTVLAALGFRLLIGVVFVYSGFGKASAPAQEFAAVISAYGLLPPNMQLPVAQILPWIELIFGVFLIAGYWTRLSARVVVCLLGAFIGALLSALLRKIPLENCGCFGSSIHLSPVVAMASDFCLMMAAAWLARQEPGPWSVDRWVASARS